MGYTFRVGNAIPKHGKTDFPHLSASWEVEPATHPEAPTFPNDEMTGSGNARSPSYTVWSDFCRQTGIYQLFYNYRGHLHAGHPGCQGITQEDGETIALALKHYRNKAALPAGFQGWDWRDGDPITHDAHLARLIWLDWWVQWALKNCETPAIENT